MTRLEQVCKVLKPFVVDNGEGWFEARITETFCPVDMPQCSGSGVEVMATPGHMYKKCYECWNREVPEDEA